MSVSNLIETAARLISKSRRLVVLTGAGVSQESGVPTFRDALTGLWEKYDPYQLATPDAFERDPALVWNWYAYRRDLVAQARPNPAHDALARMADMLPDMQIITQNVDDLHERAGSRNLIHLHGQIARSKCSHNCQGEPTVVNLNTLPGSARENTPPLCPHCGAYLRPDVVWFGEALAEAALTASYELCHNADVMLVVGTSGAVQPAASMPFVAKQAGASIIEINPGLSSISHMASIHLAGPAGEILPRIVKAMQDA